jgi:hypothetical protein
MAEATESINPRHLREKLGSWLGKRVVVGTRTYHYLCGIWKAMEGDHVIFEIGGKEMRVGLSDIATVGDAEAWQADFYK